MLWVCIRIPHNVFFHGEQSTSVHKNILADEWVAQLLEGPLWDQEVVYSIRGGVIPDILKMVLARARETEESKSVQHIFAPKTEIAEPIFGNFRNGRLFPFGIIFQFQNTGC